MDKMQALAVIDGKKIGSIIWETRFGIVRKLRSRNLDR